MALEKKAWRGAMVKLARGNTSSNVNTVFPLFSVLSFHRNCSQNAQ